MLGADLGEDGGTDEIRTWPMRQVRSQDGAPFLFADFDILHDLAHRPLVNQWTKCGPRVLGHPHVNAARRFDQALDKAVMDCIHNDQARTGRAFLALIPQE